VKVDFDYQSKVWGTVIPSDSPFSLTGLRMYHFLPHIRYLRGNLLEIGCGAGGNLAGITRYTDSFDLYGVDISKNAIDFGTREFNKLHLTVSSAEHLDFPDGYFDVVCFFDVLEHVADPSVCIRESVRVLKKGGLFHAYVPCEGEIFSVHGILNACGINLKKDTAGHIQKLTKKDLLIYCESAGLRIVETAWSCHLINQIGDIAYYLYLTLSHKRLSHSLEGSFSHKSLWGFARIARICVSLVSFIWYWESRILWFVPGAGVHITAVKK
jgi:ubiquinone/menaquinone biosynthesis C-methylase UbiE